VFSLLSVVELLKERAAHLPELSDFFLEQFFTHAEFFCEAAQAEILLSAPADELFRQGDLVSCEGAAAFCAGFHIGSLHSGLHSMIL